jgi:hypothetical protein
VSPEGPRIALATCEAWPRLTDDDRPLLEALAAHGLSAEPVPWRGGADWGAYRGVLLRSVWDYFEHASEFSAWLARLETGRVPVWNPVPLVRWNLDKGYLRDLEARGVPVVPTLWTDPGAGAEAVVARVRATGWPEVVLKPTVSAGAWRTLRVPADEVEAHRGAIREILAGSGLMAQPFLPEVLEAGEWSFVFFRGEWSHAVVKRPRPGDFRVQWTHGGTHAVAAPPAGLLAQARAVLDAAPSPGLYARVDGVVRGGRFLLMELEQIEPYLFFGESEASAERFVHALRREMGEG